MNFIITNREIITKNGKETIRPDGLESAGDNLRFGEYDGKNFILYPEPKNPIDLDYHTVDTQNVDNLSGSSRFFSKLYQEIIKAKKTDNKGDVLFFIHGFNNDIDDIKETFKTLHERYVKPKDSPIAHIVIFTWPSCSPFIPVHYHDDKKDAKRSGEALARCFEKLYNFYQAFFVAQRNDGKIIRKNEFCGQKIHLMVHSMGNQVLGSALTQLSKNVREVFGEILLMASDIKYSAFEKDNAYEFLIDMGERVHIYYHEHDVILDISKYTKNANNRLGRYGRKKKTQGEDIFDLDVSNTTDDLVKNLKHDSLNHWYYYSSSEVIKDVIAVMNGKVSKFYK